MSSRSLSGDAQRLASMCAEDAVLVRACLQQERMRWMSTRAAETARDAGAGRGRDGRCLRTRSHGDDHQLRGRRESRGERAYRTEVHAERSARRSPVLPARLGAAHRRPAARGPPGLRRAAGHLTFRLGSLTRRVDRLPRLSVAERDLGRPVGRDPLLHGLRRHGQQPRPARPGCRLGPRRAHRARFLQLRSPDARRAVAPSGRRPRGSARRPSTGLTRWSPPPRPIRCQEPPIAGIRAPVTGMCIPTGPRSPQNVGRGAQG